MMLTLLLYPLRKRFRFASKLGALPKWFRWHMLLGILGPLTIIFHSTYHVYIPYIHPIGSPNAAVAMFSMLLVAGSGIFGRFFYTKIHHGLYGRMSTLERIAFESGKFGRFESRVQRRSRQSEKHWKIFVHASTAYARTIRLSGS